MAVIPVNSARVSQNMRALNMLTSMQVNQRKLLQSYNQLSTGLRFTMPSEDPTGAVTAGAVSRQLDRIRGVKDNLTTVTAVLGTAEAAFDETANLLREAQRITLEAVGDTIGTTERQSLAAVVTSLIDQAVALGNRQHLQSYLFSGQETGQAPFAWGLGGIEYRGDEGRRAAIVDTDLSQSAFTVSGMDFFGAISTPVTGAVDLSPSLTRDTRICDLRTADGTPPMLGRLAVTTAGQTVQVDLSAADTVGDVVDALNGALPPPWRAELDTNRIRLSGVGTISISDVGGGQAARQLGLAVTGAAAQVLGSDLDPQLTPRTTLAALHNGQGLDLSGGLTIANGEHAVTLDLSGARTLEDVMNAINGAGIGAWARIGPDGNRLDIHNRISGTDLRVSEAGGTLATQLGVRTIRTDTPLSEFNLGRGVGTVNGPDIRFTTADGTVVEVDLDGARTLRDVLDRLNADGAVTASLDTHGNGLVVRDNTVGGGTLTAAAVNHSPALADLGLNVVATGGRLVGDDAHPVRVEGVFTALLELRDGLLRDDTRSINFAGTRLERMLTHVERVRGEMAALARAMDERSTRVEVEESATLVLQSDVRDVDFTEAVVRFQQVQTALQANLNTASTVMNLSLLDFLK